MFCIVFECCEKKVGIFGHLPGNILLTSTRVNTFVAVPADSVGEKHDAKVHPQKRKTLLQWPIVGG